MRFPKKQTDRRLQVIPKLILKKRSPQPQQDKPKETLKKRSPQPSLKVSPEQPATLRPNQPKETLKK